MDTTIPYLRSQSDILAEIKTKVRLGSTTRWTDVEIYTALNEALMTWFERVRLPHIYTIPGGWLASEYSYALPSYVRPPLVAQLKRQLPFDFDYVTESTTHTWQDVPGAETEPDGEGGLVLRLHAAPRALEGRVIFYAPNSRVPTALPTTSGSTAADATSLVLGSAVDVDDTGYVKVGAEWMSYAGVTRGASTTTLNNLIRGLYGTTAAVHDSASTVTWGVAMDDMRLNKFLYDQMRTYLNAYFLNDGGTHEIGRHEKALGYYDNLAEKFWQTYQPRRPSPKLTLGRKVFILR